MPEKPAISVVDDDASVREGLKDLLDAMGFDVETFASAQDFLDSYRLHVTGCLITDMRMPEMSGLALHAELVAAGRRIPTIVVTAFPNPRDRERALRQGVFCYLPKPFDERALLDCIKSALEARPHGRPHGSGA
jgi:FixJ family two-component response regulator